MHSTHHNQLKILKLGLCLEKRVIIYKKGEGEGGEKKLSRLQKVTWWLLPLSTHHFLILGPYPTTQLAMVKKKKSYHFIFSTGLNTVQHFFWEKLILKSCSFLPREMALARSSFLKATYCTLKLRCHRGTTHKRDRG